MIRDLITIVHGGQTGVDRGAHAGAMKLGLKINGFAPGDARDEDGPIPIDVMKHLVICFESGLPARTRMNVQASDVVVLIQPQGINQTPGTALTQRLATQRGKPTLIVDAPDTELLALGFLKRNILKPTKIMIAGPRGSKWPAGKARAIAFVEKLAAL